MTLFGFISPNCWVEICPQRRVRAEVQRGEEALVLPGAWGRSGALPGQGCPERWGQESRMEGCQAFWQAFLLTQLGKAHWFRIPVKLAPAGKALRDPCVYPPLSGEELEARKKGLAPVSKH